VGEGWLKELAEQAAAADARKNARRRAAAFGPRELT